MIDTRMPVPFGRSASSAAGQNTIQGACSNRAQKAEAG